MFSWLRRKTAAAPPPPAPAPERDTGSFWSTHAAERRGGALRVADYLDALRRELPKYVPEGTADDDGNGDGIALKLAATAQNIPEVLAAWYASQTFIGHQLAAILAQHWLIDKACGMPGRDAIRQGFDIVSASGDEIPPEAIKILKAADRRVKLNAQLEEFVRKGRIFGIRIALFKVESTDPEYYEKPFNPDGVTPGSYKGIVQVDPYWTAPMLDQAASSRPDTAHFYEPTWWQINGQRYHRSHLVIFRNSEVPDLLKPQYLYGGVPVPQRIMERVYGAERTANEAPQLAQTKRTTVWLTDMAQFAALGDDGVKRMADWASYRDNYAIKLGDAQGDKIEQFDTSLADLDSVIMTQYQIVAAAANVPATKLLGTSPKGFNATGEFEEASYHEELESIQAHDLTPLVERHHLLVMRSEVVPKMAAMKDVETTVEWRPVDSPTAGEQAELNLKKAQTGQALVASGAIGSEEERQRIALDPSSGYAGVDLTAPPADDGEDDDDGDDPAAE
jgi:phage-related protein (TIGR01555 family)